MSLTAGALHGANPHDLDDRAAMGLPDRLVTRISESPGQSHRDLFGVEPGTLGVVLGQTTEPLERRLVAGTLLGLRGDLRIVPEDPEMVDVQGGRSLIGLPWGRVNDVVRTWEHCGVRRDWIVKECPQHEVTVSDIRIMRYPVTNLEYRRFLEDTGHWPAPTSWSLGLYPFERANHPVWTVRPQDADRYASWLSERSGRRFRLPTEIEWEYVASGGDGRAYPWGEEFRADGANTLEGGPLGTTPVGVYPRGQSVTGVDDLAGNVEEYVADDYRPWPGGHEILDDLVSGGRPSYRVARGGSFSRFGDLTRCARRHGWYQRDCYAVGFRLVEDTFAMNGRTVVGRAL